MKTRDNARGRWHGILKDYGVQDLHLTGKHTPCPLCGGKDRFRFDNRNGDGTYFCSNCGSGDGLRLLVQYTGKPFSQIAQEIDKTYGEYERREARRVVPMSDRLQRIGRGLKRISDNDPVSKYLASRGLGSSHDYLRIHPKLSYYDLSTKIGDFPAMVAAFSDNDGKIITYHLTYLTPEGKKAPVDNVKKVASSMGEGGAIRLSEPTKKLGLAEGIETAIAVKLMYGVDCWAAVSASNMRKFTPPPQVEQLIIYADNDANFTGQAAAYDLAARLAKDIEVRIQLPQVTGTDYADARAALVNQG